MAVWGILWKVISWQTKVESIIPHICHRRHRRRLCKFFLPGVIFSQIEREKLAFYCIVYNNLRPSVYAVYYLVHCILHTLCNYTHNNVIQSIPSCVVFTRCVINALCVIFGIFPILPQTKCAFTLGVVLQTVCNLTNFVYFLFFPKRSELLRSAQCVALHSVCSFTLSV